MFIDDINSWFDIFNSHVKTSPDPNRMKAPFGIYLHEQEQHLNKVKDMIYSMRAEGKNSFCTHSLESNASNIQRSLRNQCFPVDSNVKIAKNTGPLRHSKINLS
jgi:hypothetical protein